MPSPFYNTDAVYGLRALLGTSNVSDIDAGFAALRDDVAAKMKGAVPRVSSLPTVGPSGSGALVDGQECYLVADATNGVQWHLRYNAGSASTYKWEFVGGAPLYAEVQTSESISPVSNTYQDLATVGPSLTLPSGVGGDYMVTVGSYQNTMGSGLETAISYAIGAGAASDADAARMTSTASPPVTSGSVSRTRRKTGLTSGVALVAKYRGNSGGGSATFANRFLAITPVRVG